jgi:hypothetical protein
VAAYREGEAAPQAEADDADSRGWNSGLGGEPAARRQRLIGGGALAGGARGQHAADARDPAAGGEQVGGDGGVAGGGEAVDDAVDLRLAAEDLVDDDHAALRAVGDGGVGRGREASVRDLDVEAHARWCRRAGRAGKPTGRVAAAPSLR